MKIVRSGTHGRYPLRCESCRKANKNTYERDRRRQGMARRKCASCGTDITETCIGMGRHKRERCPPCAMAVERVKANARKREGYRRRPGKAMG